MTKASITANITLKPRLRDFISSPVFIRLLPYLLILVVVIICCLPLFSNSVPFGDDTLFHAYRYKGTVDALTDGQFIPQVDPQALYGFGHGWNIFYGPLPTYVTALLHLIIPNWSIVINILTVTSVLLSGIFMFRYIREVSTKTFIGLMAAVLYVTAPYHLFDIYSRQAGGEIIAFVFVPLVFHGLWRILNNRKKNTVLLLVAGATGLVLTHNLSAALVAIFAICYLLCNVNTIIKSWKRILKNLIISGLIVVGLSAFFIVPLLEVNHVGIYNIFDPSYTSVAMGINGDYLNSWRISFSNFFINPSIVNSYSDTKPFAIGLVTIISFALLLVSLQKMPKATRKYVVVFVALSLLSLLLSSRLIDWTHIPHILLSIQFPWRLLFIALFFTSIVSAYSLYYSVDRFVLVIKRLNKIRKPFMATVLICLIAASIGTSANIIPGLHSGNKWNGTYNYNSTEGVGGGEYLPKTSAVDDKLEIESRIQNYLAQNGRNPVSSSKIIKITGYTQSGTNTHFNITSDNSSNQFVTLPYIYYPGYKASYKDDNGHYTKITTGPSVEGFVNLYISGPMNGEIATKYGISKGTFVGILISSSTIVLCLVVVLVKRKSSNNS